MKYLVVLVACLAYASASEIKLEQPQERIISSFIQSTDGYTYLGLNETYLWGAVGVAAVLGVVMLVMASGVLPEAAQKIQRYGQEFSKSERDAFKHHIIADIRSATNTLINKLDEKELKYLKIHYWWRICKYCCFLTLRCVEYRRSMNCW